MDLSRFRATAERTGSDREVKPGWQTRLPATVSRDHFVSTILSSPSTCGPLFLLLLATQGQASARVCALP